MSYYWKKNSLKVVIDSDSKDKTEVLDLTSDNKLDKFSDKIGTNSDLMIINGHTHDQHDHLDQSEDESKNGENESEQIRTNKRNPKCARCANHIREPVAVKGHKRKCPYKECMCRLCNLTVERRELMAKTIREKRKQKEDLADNSYVYNEPVFKKHRTDESSSETDRESGYSTEENEKIKLIDNEYQNEELIKGVDGLVPIIWRQLTDKLTPIEIGQTLLDLYLKAIIPSIVKHKSSANSITKQIMEASKRIAFNGLRDISPKVPIPLAGTPLSPLSGTPLTPITPSSVISPFLTPPSSVSSTASPESPNDSYRGERAYNPFLLNQYHQQLISLGYRHPFIYPSPPSSVLNQRLAGL